MDSQPIRQAARESECANRQQGIGDSGEYERAEANER
tara:strand:- start:350 stop:460 length:111 start_codon:yes stop_codon:yes gene_type:complete